MGEDPSVPPEMYQNETEEAFVTFADAEGLSIELVDRDERTYWLNPGVTDWSHGRIQEWAEDLLDGRDYSADRLPEGPVEVTVY